MANKTNGRIFRFGVSARVAHWGHTVTFLVLLFTGLVLFAPGLGLASVFGGYVSSGVLHRIMAVFYTAIPLICLIANPRGFIDWWKDVFNYTKNDIKFVMIFPLELFGIPVKIPPQSKFNGGEKINSLVTTTSCVLLAISGYIMWFSEYFPVWLVRISYPTHAVCMVIATVLVCVHSYLGSLHPNSREALQGMLRGSVSAEWAKHHHGTWYEKMTKGGK